MATAAATSMEATATSVEAAGVAHPNSTPSVATAAVATTAVAVATAPVNHPAGVEIVRRVEPKPERTEEHALAR